MPKFIVLYELTVPCEIELDMPEGKTQKDAEKEVEYMAVTELIKHTNWDDWYEDRSVEIIHNEEDDPDYYGIDDEEVDADYGDGKDFDGEEHHNLIG